MSAVAKGPWEEHRFEDIQFHARISTKGEGWIDYEVYDLTFYDDGEGPPLKFIAVERNGHGMAGLTNDIEKAERFMHGAIKWDGCSHNNFASEYIHGCERKEMTRLGALFEKLFDIACWLMPQHADEYLR